MLNDIYGERKDFKAEDSLFSQVLEPYKTEIAEIREAYKLILGLLMRFKEIYPSVDLQLSIFYTDLFELIEKAIESIEDNIYSKYDPSNGRGFPDFYIETDIYKNFYKPYANLYESQAEGEKLDNWGVIQGKLDICYAQVDELYHKFHAEEVGKLPHQALFQETSDYLMKISHNHKLECRGLSLDLKRGVLQYKTNPSKEISLDSQEIKFLILLMQNKGEIVEHQTIARELKLNFYDKDTTTNKDAAEDTRYIKRDLRTLLITLGMSEEDFKTFITTQKNVGYKLNCD